MKISVKLGENVPEKLDALARDYEKRMHELNADVVQADKNLRSMLGLPLTQKQLDNLEDAKLTNQTIDQWARKYAEAIYDVYLDVYCRVDYGASQDMSMREFEAYLAGADGWQELQDEMQCPLEGAEFRFMLAAIPGAITDYQDIIFDTRFDTPDSMLKRSLDKLGYLTLKSLNGVLLPPMRWLTRKLRAYNERKGNHD